jgi:para-aminobenzoate synthetase component I
LFASLPTYLNVLAQQLGTHDQAWVLLGDVQRGWADSGWVYLGYDPLHTLTLTGEETLATGEAAITEFLAMAPVTPLPTDPAVFAMLGYAAARWCDPAMAFVRTTDATPAQHNISSRSLPLPALQWVIFKHVVGVHVATGQTRPIAGSTQAWWATWAQSLVDAYTDKPPIDKLHKPVVDTTCLSDHGFTPSLSLEGFTQAVEVIQDAIQQGEFYQANLSLVWQKSFGLANGLTSPLGLYAAASQHNPSPFAGVWHVAPDKWAPDKSTPDWWVLSNSPERLVSLTDQGKVITRPIAGTRGPGVTAPERQAIAHTLTQNPKELAEHAMLVDLQRNDIGKVCVPGSVYVSEWLSAEYYSHVTHLVSQVEGHLKPAVSLWQLIQAVFPGGTITGCPKIRCMQTIEALEPLPRGGYTGSLGWLNPQAHTMDLNIMIRSVWLQHTGKNAHGQNQYTAQLHAGAGIVLDSIAAHEYRECYRKAALWLQVLGLAT